MHQQESSNACSDSVGRSHDESIDVFESIAKWIPRADDNTNFWWTFSGPHLATMLRSAEYPLRKQYEMLLFFYHYICPCAGPAPTMRGPTWATLMSTDGTNMDYSWRWNSSTGAPDVRFIMEPMDRFTGTVVDPLNMNPTSQLAYDLSKGRPDIELSLFSAFHNSALLYDSEKPRYLAKTEMPPYTTTCVSFEMYRESINMKAYWAGKKLGQKGLMSLEQYESAISAVVPPSAACKATFEFIKTTGPELGYTFSPFMIGIDLAKETRLKLYTQIPFTRFDKVKDCMTMHGAIQVAESSFDALWELIQGFLGLSDYPMDQEVPGSLEWDPRTDTTGSEGYKLLGSFHIYFDIGPNRDVPDIKLYIPTGHYSPNDMVVARGVTEWMARHNRGQYVDGYWKVLESIAKHRNLEDGKGIHSYVAMMIQANGEIQVTSYLTPEGFHPGRLSMQP